MEKLPKATDGLDFSNVEGASGLGCSIIRRGRTYLLFRHGPYGGEHDHYDRLGLSYYYDNIPISIDMGTTGYGARLHYAYYKNTASHNTICINGENQAPSSGHLLEYREEEDYTFVKAEVEWEVDYEMPDSFTIKQWSDDDYLGVRAMRSVIVADGLIIDLVKVDGVKEGSLVYNIHHYSGRRTDIPQGEEYTLGTKGPLGLLWDVRREKSIVSSYENKEIHTKCYSFLDGDIIRANGYDNPSSSSIGYVIQQAKGNAVFLTVVLSSNTPREERPEVEQNIRGYLVKIHGCGYLIY